MIAWIFDVDGVLTNPTEKKIVELQIFDKLIEILKSGDIVGLNTGRSLVFVMIFITSSGVSTKQEGQR